jgi:hypothetical protein
MARNAAALGAGWRPTEVHPLAAIFPRMSEDELNALAEDIKQNGLIHPIVIGPDGELVDGINRLAACDRAGVEPRFQQLNGQDVAAFIVSANLNRRNMNEGQKAIALAKIYPEAKKGRPKAGNVGNFNIDRGLLSHARDIVAHSTKLADDVLYHGKRFDHALQEVRRAEQGRQANDAQMAELNKYSSVIAAMVTDGRQALWLLPTDTGH